MKNYYDELEVNKNASPEVINKAYRVLAKKYHPDMAEANQKQAAELKFKRISEAYEILSNEEKRKAYDEELARIEAKQPTSAQYNNLVNSNQELQHEVNNLKSKLNHMNQSSNRTQSTGTQHQTYAPQQQYYVYETRRPPTFMERIKFRLQYWLRNILAFVLTVLVICITFYLLFHIPYTRNFLLHDMGFQLIFDIFQQ